MIHERWWSTSSATTTQSHKKLSPWCAHTHHVVLPANGGVVGDVAQIINYVQVTGSGSTIIRRVAAAYFDSDTLRRVCSVKIWDLSCSPHQWLRPFLHTRTHGVGVAGESQYQVCLKLQYQEVGVCSKPVLFSVPCKIERNLLLHFLCSNQRVLSRLLSMIEALEAFSFDISTILPTRICKAHLVHGRSIALRQISNTTLVHSGHFAHETRLPPRSLQKAL